VSTPFRLEVPRDVYEAMVAQAQAELPNECCGLLAGVVEEGIGRVVKRYPLVNRAASGKEYLADGSDLCAAHRDMRERKLEVLVIYHSHPTSDPVPSKTDLARNYWPGVVHLIIGLAGPEPAVRGWWLTETDFSEADWVVARPSS
jgi:proteasome lid subunit RPN8/RPN11